MNIDEVKLYPYSGSDADFEIAQTILNQIYAMDETALGVVDARRSNRFPVEKGIALRKVIVKHDSETGRNRRGTIQITLNALDTYDVVAFTVDKNRIPNRVVFTHNDLHYTQLAGVLHDIVFGE